MEFNSHLPLPLFIKDKIAIRKLFNIMEVQLETVGVQEEKD